MLPSIQIRMTDVQVELLLDLLCCSGHTVRCFHIYDCIIRLVDFCGSVTSTDCIDLVRLVVLCSETDLWTISEMVARHNSSVEHTIRWDDTNCAHYLTLVEVRLRPRRLQQDRSDDRSRRLRTPCCYLNHMRVTRCNGITDSWWRGSIERDRSHPRL